MSCEQCNNQHEERSVTRLLNRALRRVNKRLRQDVENLKEHGDTVFAVLCEQDALATEALREIWERGGFQPPIGPDDYDVIVKRCVSALQAQIEHESHTSPVSSIGSVSY